nr:hypothetical protein [uncultured Roseateles sp.]
MFLNAKFADLVIFVWPHARAPARLQTYRAAMTPIAVRLYRPYSGGLAGRLRQWQT